jgi:hypothetical protein
MKTGSILSGLAVIVTVVGVATVFLLIFLAPKTIPKGDTSTFIVPPPPAVAGSPGACTPVACDGSVTGPWTSDGNTVTFSNGIIVNGNLNVGDIMCQDANKTSSIKTIISNGATSLTGQTNVDTLTTTASLTVVDEVVTSSISPVDNNLQVNGSLAITKFLAVNTSQTDPTKNKVSSKLTANNLKNGTVAAFYLTQGSSIVTIAAGNTWGPINFTKDDATASSQGFPFVGNYTS